MPVAAECHTAMLQVLNIVQKPETIICYAVETEPVGARGQKRHDRESPASSMHAFDPGLCLALKL